MKSTGFAGVMAWMVVSAAQAAQPVLVPAPKQVRWLDGGAVAIADGTAAIVVGSKAVAPELAAAELLQAHVAKRFNAKWPVVKESDDLGRYAVRVVLGQTGTNGLVERLCREHKVQPHQGQDGVRDSLGGKAGGQEELPLSGPAGAFGTIHPDPVPPKLSRTRQDGDDGYAIEPIVNGDVATILVAGSNARGVTYGQDTLFQLLQQEAGKLRLVKASVRDWASVPWRGRPMTDVKHYLEPGVWECLVASRMNWIDLRNGTYAFEGDYKFTDEDKANIAKVIGDAHRHDILVYGAVNVGGIKVAEHAAALEKFKQFIDMGVDGLWLSFDDKGPGEAPEKITAALLKLGREHGITGNRIATTPPKSSYQVIVTDFNRKVMAVPGMEEALWFWTPLPGERMTAESGQIGLKTKPSWWHNWPRPTRIFAAGAGNDEHGAVRSYIQMPEMSVGWHRPTTELIAQASLQSAVPWSGSGVPQWYVAPTFGWWSWDPASYDWTAVRSRVYGIVYGAAQAGSMMELDDTLGQAKAMFAFPGRDTSAYRPFCPPKLKDIKQRSTAIKLLERCESLAGQIIAAAPQSTMLDLDVIQKDFLRPIKREVGVGRACARLEFPEYWWDPHHRAVLDAVYEGDLARADALIAEARPRVLEEIKAIGEQLDTLSITAPYAKWWTKTANMSAADVKQQMAERQKELVKRLAHYDWFSVVTDKLIANVPNVPTGMGRGAADRQLRVMATVSPEIQEQYWGDWIAGPHKAYGVLTTLFAVEPDASSRAGDYVELPVRLPIRGDRDRLGLLMYMNCWTKEKLGLEDVPGRYLGYVAIQLLWGDKVLWEGDPGVSRTGHEWDLVKLPAIPEGTSELSLRLRAFDKKDSSGMHTIMFVGPIRLVEMPGVDEAE